MNASSLPCLGPDLQEGVPGAGAEGCAVNVDAEARDAIVVAFERPNELAFERVPHAAVVVVVAGKEEAPRNGEGHGRHTDEDGVAGEGLELAIGAQIPEAARRVVGAGREREAVVHHLDRVDVALMAVEGLRGLARSDIPMLGVRIDSASDERIVMREERKAHHIAVVAGEFSDLHAAFNIPQHARSITRGSDDLLVIEESAAGKVARMSIELSAHPNR